MSCLFSLVIRIDIELYLLVIILIHHEETIWTLLKLIRIALGNTSHNMIVTAWTDESRVDILGWGHWGLVYSLSLEKKRNL